MTMNPQRNLAAERSASWQFALGSLRNGSLRGLNEALAWACEIGLDIEDIPWVILKARKDEWAAIEAEFGHGALLNLDAPMVVRMREASEDLPDPAVILNADKFRASSTWDPDLYSLATRFSPG